MASKKIIRKRALPTHWSPLKEGDVVDLVAPAFACEEAALDGAVRFLKDWGLEPRVPKRIFGRDVLCANTDGERFSQLKAALTAPDSQAVWCLRGGYGSLRLMNELTRLRRPAGRPKLFIGLSDISTLHVYLNQAWGWPTVHGPLLDRLGKGLARPAYVKELRRFVFGETTKIVFDQLRPLNEAARKKSVLHAPVSGGNMVTLQSSLGTRAEWDTRGQILFFEEIGERGYKIDRMLEQFEQIGKFKNAKAVIFGEFLGGLEADGSSKIPALLKRFAEAQAIPVLSGLKSGHGVIQRPVPFYTNSSLHLSPVEKGCLICETGGAR